MAALLVKAGVPAMYFASGSEGEPDMDMGRQFAGRFQLPFRTAYDSQSATDAEWEDAIWRLVKQTDGMSTLAHVCTALRGDDQLSARCVHLYGAGGEIGRANFFQRKPLYYLLPTGHAGAKRALRDLMMSYRRNLVRPEAEALATGYLDQFVDHMHDDGFASSELEALFYMEERVHRWAGNNFRQITSRRDVFTPYCTRAYATASFSVPLLYRYADHIHYELLGYLDRDMQQFPLEVPWYPQRPLPLTMQLLTRYYEQTRIARLACRVRHRIQRPKVAPSRHNERAAWLERFLPGLRQRVLDQSSSPLWDMSTGRAWSTCWIPIRRRWNATVHNPRCLIRLRCFTTVWPARRSRCSGGRREKAYRLQARHTRQPGSEAASGPIRLHHRALIKEACATCWRGGPTVSSGS